MAAEPKYIGLQGILRTEKDLEMAQKKQRVRMGSEESDCMQYDAGAEEAPEGADTKNAHSKHSPTKAKGPSGKKRWMQKESVREEKAGTKGALRRMTKTKAGNTIPTELIEHLAKKGGHIGKMANLALRYRGK